MPHLFCTTICCAYKLEDEEVSLTVVKHASPCAGTLLTGLLSVIPHVLQYALHSFPACHRVLGSVQGVNRVLLLWLVTVVEDFNSIALLVVILPEGFLSRI